MKERLDAIPTQLLLTIAWVIMMPLAIATGWIYLVAFVSVVSIYANAASHWSAHLAWRAKREAQGE